MPACPFRTRWWDAWLHSRIDQPCWLTPTAAHTSKGQNRSGHEPHQADDRHRADDRQPQPHEALVECPHRAVPGPVRSLATWFNVATCVLMVRKTFDPRPSYVSPGSFRHGDQIE